MAVGQDTESLGALALDDRPSLHSSIGASSTTRTAGSDASSVILTRVPTSKRPRSGGGVRRRLKSRRRPSSAMTKPN